MVQNLPQRKRKASVIEREAHSCPVCMEPTKDDCFSFPCGHLICSECNGKMISHSFLACPTCRTPREGVSQQEVDSANLSRVAVDTLTDTGLSVNNTATRVAIIFFPDESGNTNPFTPLDAANNLLYPCLGSPTPIRERHWGMCYRPNMQWGAIDLCAGCRSLGYVDRCAD